MVCHLYLGAVGFLVASELCARLLCFVVRDNKRYCYLG